MNITLIGCGIWGRIILRNLIDLNVSVSVLDTDPEIQKKALENGANLVIDDIKNLDKNDAIIIATPATTHADIILQLDNSGNTSPIFCEKPLTESSKTAQKLLNRKGPPLYVMHIWCHHPGIRLLKKLCDQGIIGKINQIKSTRANWTSPRQDVDCLSNLAPHDLSIFQYLLGNIPEPTFVSTEIIDQHIVGCTTIFKNKNQTTCIFEVSNRYAEKRREIRVHGTKGVLVLPDDQVGSISHIQPGGFITAENIKQYPYEKTSALQTELSDFLHFLKTDNSEKLCSATNGAEIVFTIDKIRKLI